jgi:hypothetical protein
MGNYGKVNYKKCNGCNDIANVVHRRDKGGFPAVTLSNGFKVRCHLTLSV